VDGELQLYRLSLPCGDELLPQYGESLLVISRGCVLVDGVDMLHGSRACAEAAAAAAAGAGGVDH
jgi:hypothetical protein